MGRGEAPGRWLGAGARLLGLSGQVLAEPLRAVLDGRDPSDLPPEDNPGDYQDARRRRGCALTFGFRVG